MSKNSRKHKKHKDAQEDPGLKFELVLTAAINDYLNNNRKRGKCYRLHSDDQFIDILVDGADTGYIGIECKSIYEDALKNDKIYLDRLNRKGGGDNPAQVFKHHGFLKSTNRLGIMAIEFRCCGDIYLIPHQLLYDAISAGLEYITVTDVIKNGYHMGSQGDLCQFIRNKCGVVN